MIDGKYQIVMKTPIGPRNGILTMITDKESVHGTLEVLSAINAFSGGKVDGNKCSFSGKIQTALSTVAYTVSGEVIGDLLTAMANTEKGNMPIIGNRILEV